jgi:hypothetical protein
LTPVVRASLIIAIALLVIAAGWVYFSPYQSCVRATTVVYQQRNYHFPAAEAHNICSRAQS